MLIEGEGSERMQLSRDRNSYKKKTAAMPFLMNPNFPHRKRAGISSDLWSFDLFVFCLASAVVSRTFAMIGFFYFVTWLRHDFHLKYIN